MTQLAERIAEVSGLDANQAVLYRQIPEEVDFVPNAGFSAVSAEEDYFGAGARLIEVSGWSSSWDVECEYDELRGSRTVRLAPRDEAILFFRYNYARYRLSLLAEAQSRRVSHLRAKAMLFWYERAQSLRARIVEANLGLVLAMAKRSRILNAEFAEMVAEGNMALLRAVEKFDAARGYRFSTYACRAILKSFCRLATKTGAYRHRFPVSHDPRLEKDSTGEWLKEEKSADMVDVLNLVIRRPGLLDAREITVLTARFDLERRGKKETLLGVSKMIGLTTERVRQIQNGALDKIRQAIERHCR